MNDQEMTVFERIDVMKNVLDNLVTANGRAKCGYITVLDDFLNKIQNEFMIKDSMIQDLQKEVDKYKNPETIETESQE